MKQPQHKLYNAAETLFCEQGMTCAAIAADLGIREGTLSDWRNRMGWDEKRKRVLSAPNKIRELLLDEMEKVINGEKTKVDTDALSKIGKALTYFDGKVSLVVVVSVLKELDNFMAEVNPQKAIEFTEYHKKFINHRAKLDSLK